MIERLISLVEKSGYHIITGRGGLPSPYSRAAATEAANAIFDVLQGALAGGELQPLLKLLCGLAAVSDSPICANIASSFAQRLTQQFGLSVAAASELSAKLIPLVLEALIDKIRSPEETEFSLNSVINELAGSWGEEFDFTTLITSGVSGEKLAEVSSRLANEARKSSPGMLSKTVANLFR